MASTYVVQPGDTLSGIADRFGVSLSDLEAANPQIVNPDLIFSGQVINIPSSESGDNTGEGGKDSEKFKDDKEKDHKDHKDFKEKEHKDHKDHKDKDHKDHKDKDHREKHDKEREKHEKEHEGHGGGGAGVHTVGPGPGVTPLVHFIGTELRPDLVQSTLRREPDLSGRGGEPAAGQDGGSDVADGGASQG